MISERSLITRRVSLRAAGATGNLLNPTVCRRLCAEFHTSSFVRIRNMSLSGCSVGTDKWPKAAPSCISDVTTSLGMCDASKALSYGVDSCSGVRSRCKEKAHKIFRRLSLTLPNVLAAGTRQGISRRLLCHLFATDRTWFAPHNFLHSVVL